MMTQLHLLLIVRGLVTRLRAGFETGATEWAQEASIPDRAPYIEYSGRYTRSFTEAFLLFILLKK